MGLENSIELFMSTAVPTCHLLALEVGDEAEGERSQNVEANRPSSDCDGHRPAIVVVKVQLVLHDRAHWLDLKRALGRQLVTHKQASEGGELRQGRRPWMGLGRHWLTYHANGGAGVVGDHGVTVELQRRAGGVGIRDWVAPVHPDPAVRNGWARDEEAEAKQPAASNTRGASWFV